MGRIRDFGGILVIFVGDLFQLKPVCDAFIFKNNCAGYAPLQPTCGNKMQRCSKMEDSLFSYWIECVKEICRSQIMICLPQGWLKLILKNMIKWKAVCIFTFKMSELIVTTYIPTSRCKPRNMISKPLIVSWCQYLQMWREHYWGEFKVTQEKLCSYNMSCT